VEVGEQTTGGDGDVSEELVELLVVVHGEPHVTCGMMCDFLLSHSALQASSRISEAASRVPDHSHHDVPATAMLLYTTSYQLSMICDACRCLWPARTQAAKTASPPDSALGALSQGVVAAWSCARKRLAHEPRVHAADSLSRHKHG
jgi:hypothetical protein